MFCPICHLLNSFVGFILTRTIYDLVIFVFPLAHFLFPILLHTPTPFHPRHSCLSTDVKVKKSTSCTKFKLRFTKYLYTLVVGDKKKAAKVKKSMPSTLKVIDISTHKKVVQ